MNGAIQIKLLILLKVHKNYQLHLHKVHKENQIFMYNYLLLYVVDIY